MRVTSSVYPDIVVDETTLKRMKTLWNQVCDTGQQEEVFAGPHCVAPIVSFLRDGKWEVNAPIIALMHTATYIDCEEAYTGLARVFRQRYVEGKQPEEIREALGLPRREVELKGNCLLSESARSADSDK